MAVLCSVTLLVSAFLLFAIQPMVAKMMLPILGGSPSVWNTAMVFYQAALLGGYFYAHVMARRIPPRRQLLVHGIVLCLPVIVLPLTYGGIHPPTEGSPIPWMLLTMAMTVGLPFFVLSASSPLIQTWFGRAGNKDPYFLYAASNVGSFLGLLSYPFLVEPRLSVVEQSTLWTWGYLVLVALVLLTGFRLRSETPALVGEAEPKPPAIPWLRKLRWIALAFIPSSQFIGVTTYLTTDIAVMPLLWVIPLAIYLLTMVFVFAKRPPIPHKWVVAVFPFALAALVFTFAAKNYLYVGGTPLYMDVRMMFGAHLAMLFLGAMLCHGELAKDRPPTAQLTEFFLWMSFGGVLGGMFNALVAPVVFVQVIEYTLILGVLALALPAREPGWKRSLVALDFAVPALIGLGTLGVLYWQQHGGGMLARSTYVPLISAVGALACVVCAARPLRFALAVAAMFGVAAFNAQSARQTLYAARSFFGVQTVEAVGDKHSLLNGRIVHGKQIFKPGVETTPLAYFHPDGPLKEILGGFPRPAEAKVAVIGLGIGSTALWSRKGESWTFYEIDGLVETIARNEALFTCLAKAEAKPTVLIGDARLRMEEAPDDAYDVIIVDAFSSDSIPAHLVTFEAFQLYQSKLKPNGLLAVHISNRFLNLEPLIAAQAAKMNWQALLCDELKSVKREGMREGREPATWAAIGPRGLDWSAFEASSRWHPAQARADVVAWTDDYSSLLPLMRWRG